MANTSAHELRGGGGTQTSLGTGLPLTLRLDIWHSFTCEYESRGRSNSTLTSNEWVSKNGRKPKSTSPSIQVTAPHVEMVLRILGFDPQKAADLQFSNT